ncbi:MULTISPECIES: RNA polymerase sigma factor [Culturomica]|jgi:RNA polymerase sigma factor (sigma-70 family)|uniref:RNA polymerase sigma factor n=1 Tax=Culturomica TaxID=1926651 RepID=UPI00033920CD|nr:MULTISPECIES: RNA polymerase sigma factor [Odoribacteraceae]RHV93774.1 RNA polymerase sigma factor [Odoribacter sp. OF09-27XD]CCZ10138.1 sigma-70 family RNA polymerase sigma factor [Odoribacter sp. CAG:788]HBO27279.1 RNA polymerase sigma factor [Culturomica sp.]
MTRTEYNNSVDNFSDDVYRFIFKACRNKELAEDIVQDSYLTLWEHVRDITYEKAKAFLFTTSYRKMIDIFRREKKNGDIENICTGQYTYEEETPDLQQILEKALDRLSPVQKTVVLLRDYEDYSYKEIAEITNLTESQVKVYIFRARNFMKEFIRTPDLVI